jgi:hypothetical protein
VSQLVDMTTPTPDLGRSWPAPAGKEGARPKEHPGASILNTEKLAHHGGRSRAIVVLFGRGRKLIRSAHAPQATSTE